MASMWTHLGTYVILTCTYVLILWSPFVTYVNCQPSSSPLTSSCPASCFTSTFSIANNTLTDDCSSRVNCLGTATFRVSQRGSFDEAINLTLTGYGLQPDVDRTISFIFHNSHERIEYSCRLLRGKPVAAWLIQGSNSTFITGTATNTSDSITCSWLFGKDDYVWPAHANYSKVNLLNTFGYKISLKSDHMTRMVAENLSKLPIYRMNFLRCCYKPHGGRNYLFITNQTATDTNFYLQAFRPIPKWITVTLTNPKGGEFSVTCNSSSAFNATVKVGTRISPMKDLRFYDIVKREAPFPDFRCLWSQALVLTQTSGTVDTRNGRYNLAISSDSQQVYTESTIGLKGASYPLLVSFTLIVTSIIFNLMV